MGGGGHLASRARIARARVETTHEKLATIFELRDYGGRLKLNESTQLVVIAPYTNTAAGISADKLKNGLRGHEGEATELVTFLRFADNHGKDIATPLVYRYEDTDGQIKERNFGIGSEFFSVKDNGKTGFWHVLANRSERPILLMVKVEKAIMSLKRE